MLFRSFQLPCAKFLGVTDWRSAALTVIDRLFDCLVRWLAPMLPFNCEEAWTERHGAAGSVHLEEPVRCSGTAPAFVTARSATSQPDVGAPTAA